MNERRRDWKTIQDAIRTVLNRDWNPIPGGTEDEYDSYIPGIYGLLARSAGEEELAKHLLAIERDRMGFRATAKTKEGARIAARRLLALHLPPLA